MFQIHLPEAKEKADSWLTEQYPRGPVSATARNVFYKLNAYNKTLI